MFESNKEELGIKQKKMLKEFANIIKDKPVKIVIKTFFSKKEKNFDKYKKNLQVTITLYKSFFN